MNLPFRHPAAALVVLLLGGTACSGASPDEAGAGANEAVLTSEQREVTDAVERFFAAMEDRDWAAYERVVDLEGTTFSQRISADGATPVRQLSQRAMLDQLRGMEQQLEERLWDPVVLIDLPMALVWTPYEFRLDGAFSHCGIDAFELFHSQAGWRITNASWTAEPDGCSPGPEAAQNVDEARAEVLGVVFRMLSARSVGDAEGYTALVVPDGTTFTAMRGDAPAHTTNAVHAARLAADAVAPELRLGGSTVLVHPPLAVVWAEFDVFDELHTGRCGTMLIKLFRMDDAWRITSTSSVEREEGCSGEAF